MIDVHAHINKKNFPQQQSEKLSFSSMTKRAKEAHVERIISVSESIHDASDVLELARASDGYVVPGVGLHPVQYADSSSERSVTLEDWEAFEPVLKRAISEKSICCVGEIGLDFSRHIVNPSANGGLSEEQVKETQRTVFRRQVQMAMEAGLPVNVHSRSAGHYALEILYECGAKSVVMHAFDGRSSYAKKAVEAGFFFSVPPSIVRSPEKQALVAALPLSHLLLESDSPALGPEKGVDNEPANIALAAAEIARIKNVPLQQVIEQTTRNAKSLFFWSKGNILSKS